MLEVACGSNYGRDKWLKFIFWLRYAGGGICGFRAHDHEPGKCAGIQRRGLLLAYEVLQTSYSLPMALSCCTCCLCVYHHVCALLSQLMPLQLRLARCMSRLVEQLSLCMLVLPWTTKVLCMLALHGTQTLDPGDGKKSRVLGIAGGGMSHVT